MALELSNDLELAIGWLELYEAKQNCCMPYDCMHHEMCSEEDGFCGTCQEMGKLWRGITRETQALWQEARRIIREREVDLARDIRERAKELESIGDFAAADRLFGSDEEW